RLIEMLLSAEEHENQQRIKTFAHTSQGQVRKNSQATKCDSREPPFNGYRNSASQQQEQSVI
ncbi:hypothetical protein, partial [Paraeggerthella hominis]|uniref:hypothetical protein n=1 Tax=Paraeggerthella hominis TaxID=2897351 RepID=UPI003D104930